MANASTADALCSPCSSLRMLRCACAKHSIRFHICAFSTFGNPITPPFEGVFSCEYASKQMRIDSLHVNRLRNIHVVRDYMLYHFDWIGHCFLLPRRQDVSGQGHPRSLASSVDISTIVYAKFRSCQGAVQKTE